MDAVNDIVASLDKYRDQTGSALLSNQDKKDIHEAKEALLCVIGYHCSGDRSENSLDSMVQAVKEIDDGVLSGYDIEKIKQANGLLIRTIKRHA